jgi:hypothetical protein
MAKKNDTKIGYYILNKILEYPSNTWRGFYRIIPYTILLSITLVALFFKSFADYLNLKSSNTNLIILLSFTGLNILSY